MFDRSIFNKVRGAKEPEEVFGPLTATEPTPRLEELRSVFVGLARELHPDRHDGTSESAEAMALLNALRDRAQTKIENGTWGKASGATIKAANTYSNVVSLAAGDISDIYAGEYDSGKRAAIKVARDPKDRDLLANEARTLEALWKPSGKEAVSFQRYFPGFIEETRLKVGGVERPANVLAFGDGGYTLTEVIARHGGTLDNRHVAWIWKRMLEGIDWVHRQGFVHSGINPDHVLVFPKNHGIWLLDWSYSAKPGGALRAISKGHRSFYPAEVLSKKPVTEGADIYMIAKCVMAMLGGNVETGEMPKETPREYMGMLHACLLPSMHRYQDAFEIYEVLKTHLRSMFGPSKFIEMTM